MNGVGEGGERREGKGGRREGGEERGGGRREEVGEVEMGEEGGGLYVLYSTLCDHIILHTPTPSHHHTLTPSHSTPKHCVV